MRIQFVAKHGVERPINDSGHMPIERGWLGGADGGGRTHTLSRVPDFESSASANSATSASQVAEHASRSVCRLIRALSDRLNLTQDAKGRATHTAIHSGTKGARRPYHAGRYPRLRVRRKHSFEIRPNLLLRGQWCRQRSWSAGPHEG